MIPKLALPTGGPPPLPLQSRRRCAQTQSEFRAAEQASATLLLRLGAAKKGLLTLTSAMEAPDWSLSLRGYFY